MKRVIFILLLLAGSFCFAETLKTGDYENIAFKEDGSYDAKTVRAIYPCSFGDYYFLEYDELKFVVYKGFEFYMRCYEKEEGSLLGSVYHYYKLTIQNMEPNCITYTKERIK